MSLQIFLFPKIRKMPPEAPTCRPISRGLSPIRRISPGNRARPRPSKSRDPSRIPKLALKYRPQQLISDSIKKHIPTLEAIYKKQLKIHPNLNGTVWVTFVILPDGTVASTQVHSADIGEKDFLTPFSQYVQRIRFSRILLSKAVLKAASNSPPFVGSSAAGGKA